MPEPIRFRNNRRKNSQRRKSLRLSPLCFSVFALSRERHGFTLSETGKCKSAPILISPTEALDLVLKRIAVLPIQTIAHADALGRTLARDVVAPLDLPPFDNSAMDGYALICADIAGATDEQPVVLQQLETIGAGDVSTKRVERGTCIKIMTGAPLPLGADAVVMREETRDCEGKIEFRASSTLGQSIRRAGSDVARGEVVLKAGTWIQAAQWAMLASLGCAHVEVHARPRVGILVTGAELVDVDAPLEAGQIHDSNGFALRALCRTTGAQTEVRRVDDNPNAVLAALNEMATRCDLIVSSGGVSAGDFDAVRDVLHARADVHFWKIAMKPGKPVMFAHFRDVPTFGLPGNPVSVMVTWEEFVRPALLRMSGRTALRRVEIRAQLAHPLRRSAGRTEFVRAHVRWENDGFTARVQGDQGSGRLSSLVGANALLVIDEATGALESGDWVKARLIHAPETE